MITTDNKGACTLECDVCGKEAEREFFDLDDTLDYLETFKWGYEQGETLESQHDYVDICPICKERRNA